MDMKEREIILRKYLQTKQRTDELTYIIEGTDIVVTVNLLNE